MELTKHIVLEHWFKEIIRGDSIKNFVEIIECTCDGVTEACFKCGKKNTKRYRFYTDTYIYAIVAIDSSEDDGYLGCTASTRKRRAGENWNRGNDLPDGKFIRETWDRIKNAIICYELIPLAPKSTRLGGDEKSVEGPSLGD